MFRRAFGIAALALLPVAAGATTLIIPAAGTGAGAGNSHWETDLFLHNATTRPVDVKLTFHDASGTAAAPATLTLAARATVNSSDVVRDLFGKTQATGAIEVTFDDNLANRIAVTSRTLNRADNGTFGQDVPAVADADATQSGSVAVLAVPPASEYRFNAGLYAVSDAMVNWELVRQDGTIAAASEVSYAAGTQFQYNGIVPALFGAATQDGDVIYANVEKGTVIAYGSAIDNGTGDPTYVPGIRTNADSHIAFGVDLNNDGVADITDANGDGVLDQPVSLYTIGYPNYFRVIVTGAGADKAKIELADQSVKNVQIIDDQGTVLWTPFGAGYTVDLKVKITVNGVTDIVTIPAVVK